MSDIPPTTGITTGITMTGGNIAVVYDMITAIGITGTGEDIIMTMTGMGTAGLTATTTGGDAREDFL